MTTLFGIIAALGSFIGAAVLLIGFTTAKSAPQEASVAALAIAFAVIPYVLFRCIQIASHAHATKEFREAMLRAASKD